MLKISGPVRAALFVTALLGAASGAGLAIGSARADECLAAPKTAAPQGQHWYYRIDRASGRKCWYLHGAMALRHRAAMRHHAATRDDADAAPTAADPPTATAATAAPVPPAPSIAAPAPAPAPASTAVDAPSAPHVTVLSVKTVTPFVATTALPRQEAPEQAPTPVAAQTPSRDGDTPAGTESGSVAKTDGAAPQGKADAAFGASEQPAQAADAARTKTAEGFILLAVVFGVAAALTAIISKLVGIYRTPRISLDPDAAWVNYRTARQHGAAKAAYGDSNVPFIDPQEHYGLSDLHAQEWLDKSASVEDRTSPPLAQTADPAQPQSPPPALSDIEVALRALRQARQNRVT